MNQGGSHTNRPHPSHAHSGSSRIESVVARSTIQETLELGGSPDLLQLTSMLSDGARDVSGSNTRSAPCPTRRLTLVGVRPGSTIHAVEQSTTFGAETSEVASNFEDEGSNASGEEDAEVPIVEEVPPVRPSVGVQRAGFELLDQWDLLELFSHRASVMRTIPQIFVGFIPHCDEGGTRRDHSRSAGEERSPARTQASVMCVGEAATASRRCQWRVDDNDAERRPLRALKFVQLGELSSGRQALEGAELAPGNAEAECSQRTSAQPSHGSFHFQLGTRPLAVLQG